MTALERLVIAHLPRLININLNNFLILNINPFKYDPHKRLNKIIHLLCVRVTPELQQKILRGFHQINRVPFLKDL